MAWRWDPYPFILLNLAFSTQAAYAAPLILLAQNRQDDRDRVSLEEDRARAERTKADTEYLARELAALRLAVGETVTRDYLRGELDKLLRAAVGARARQSTSRRLIRSSAARSSASRRSAKCRATPARWVRDACFSRANPASVIWAATPRPSLLDRAAGDQPAALQPVDQPGDPGARQQHRVGQLGHPQPVLRRLHQLHEHVVGGERKLLLGDQLDLERTGDHRVRAQERPPGRQLLAG